VIFAARAACVDNVEIGDGARIGAGSSVFEDVAPGATVWGSPARDKVLEMRIQALLGKLPEMWRVLRRLVKGS
jgi:UDP-3-O-[3-hydroxymyristoyl] glucosamine N-acyltransferase